MKSFLFTVVMLSFFGVHAQYDFTDFSTNSSLSDRIDHVDNVYFISNNIVPANTNDLVLGDTVFLPLTVGEITASPAGSAYDTLTVEISFTVWANTAGGAYDIILNDISYSHSNLNGITSNYGEFKLLEGTTDTLMVVVKAGVLQFDRFDVRSTNSVVISNLSSDLASFDINIVNPVQDIMNIALDGDHKSFVITSTDGKVLKSFEVEGSEAVSMKELEQGMYLLKEINSGFTKRFIKN